MLGLQVLDVEGVRKDELNFFLITVFYCCDIPEVKNTLNEKYGIAVSLRCVRHLISVDDIPHLLNCD